MKEPPLLENKIHCHCFPLSGSAVHVCKFRMHSIQLDLCILCHMSDTFCGQHYLDCLPPYTKHMLNWRFCYKPLRILCKFILHVNSSEQQDFSAARNCGLIWAAWVQGAEFVLQKSSGLPPLPENSRCNSQQCWCLFWLQL